MPSTFKKNISSKSFEQTFSSEPVFLFKIVSKGHYNRLNRAICGQAGLAVSTTDVRHQPQIQLSRGEICVANLKAPLRMVRVGIGLFIRLRVTDPQGYSVYGWVKHFCA